MVNINKKKECCGCYGCINICPKKAISMKIDNEGFFYPIVNKEVCVECGLCEKICPVKNNIKKNVESNIKAYACKNKSEEDRKTSSSGGVFFLLAKEVIENKGVVFGASFDEKMNLHHDYGKTLNECSKFKGSKYVQSIIGEETYKKVEEFLKERRIVLFTGTPCQIKGLNLFLRKEYDNLITAEIVCHGVPSPKVFNMYKEILKKKYKSEIKSINFRDKKTGWKNYSFTTNFENYDVYSQKWHENSYMSGFLNKLFLRPSCYACQAKGFSSGSDLTLGDYWGVEGKHKGFDDDKGVSIVFAHTNKGNDILRKIAPYMEMEETDVNYAILNNSKIKKSARLTKNRKRFFEKVDKLGLEETIFKYRTSVLKEIAIIIFNKIKKLKY